LALAVTHLRPQAETPRFAHRLHPGPDVELVGKKGGSVTLYDWSHSREAGALRTSQAVAASGDLLERAEPLAALEHHFAAVAMSSAGRFVFIGGEAGVGKTSLVRHFCANQSVRILSGACDALATPHPLGRCSTSPGSRLETSRRSSAAAAGPMRSLPHFSSSSAQAVRVS
jgi:hypothetical protein